MTRNPKTKRLLINFLIVLILVAGTVVAVQYSKGYRPNIKNGQIQGTGLLSVTSYPKSARVNLNDKLTTVTDDKLYLAPGSYTIKIEKDGFHPWVKNTSIKSELVTSADARLFPLIPATSPLTFYQVVNPATNPDGTKIAYVLQNAPVSSDNGLYVYSFTNNLLGSQTLQIADSSKDWSTALLIWSPDSTEILAIFTEKTSTLATKSKPSITTEKITSSFLLSGKNLNSSQKLPDVTYRLPQIVSEWQDKFAKINQPTLALYPKVLQELLTQKSVNVYFSPDKEKVVYSPTENLALPKNDIGSALPNTNSTKETRELTKGSTYIFDLKEGTNYQITSATSISNHVKNLISSVDATPSSSLETLKNLKSQNESLYTTNHLWYGNNQLIITSQDGVSMVDYDNLNQISITSASLSQNFVVPSPDGNKIVLLTNINQKPSVYNLISFDLK